LRIPNSNVRDFFCHFFSTSMMLAVDGNFCLMTFLEVLCITS